MSASGEFVKSATTSVPTAKSQAEVITILGRYGASGFGFRRRGDVVSVTFHMPRAKGDTRDDHTVEIPVDLANVRQRLDGPAGKAARRKAKKGGDASPEQVERVAWRLLVLWIDAALAAVSLGAQTLEDAFLAHMIVTDASGGTGRLGDYMATLEFAGVNLPPMQALRQLAAGDDSPIVKR